ncbi:polysaccharide biosynthesis tyrosine autokinase [Leifsonia sp. NPDC014704]|uniref:polysaccharide biosynthesis tyrosine autokinase n=1 Tax=Leifsonia sp. NPDC014704 TaxID=3364123 RepID=UPI0036F46610
MSSKQYAQAFRRFWYVVVIATIAGAMLGFGLSQLAVKSYTATSGLYFSLNFGGSANDLSQGSTYTQNQMLSFAQLAESPVVLSPVVDQLDLAITPSQLADSISVSTPQNTVILELAVTDTSPRQAADIANAVAASLSSTVEQIAPKTAQGAATVSVRVIEHAAVPKFASSPNTRLNVLSGLLLGLIAGALIVVLRATFDTGVHNAETATEVAKAPLVGSIQRERNKDGVPVLVSAPLSNAAEAYRQLRSNLEFVTLGSPTRSFVITSSIPSEGKSLISSNLALALSETGQRVLLIDADLRRPAIAGYTSLSGNAGLTSVLAGRAEFDDVVQRWGAGDLDVLAAGPIPPNPSELLSSRAMSDLLERLRARYDVIVIDTAPLGSVADASILARQVDGALVVVDRTRVRKQQLAQTVDSLQKSGAAVLGIVLNRVASGKERNAYYMAEQPPRRLGLPGRRGGAAAESGETAAEADGTAKRPTKGRAAEGEPAEDTPAPEASSDSAPSHSAS